MADDQTEGVEVIPAAPLLARPPAVAALASVVTRLGEVLESETAALRQRRPADLDSFCDRKNQALLELSRIGQKLGQADLDAELQGRLTGLRAHLEENEAMLALQLRAVRDVADILATAIRDTESDGTYSTRGIAHPGAAGAGS